jgi:hypothetical protein
VAAGVVATIVVGIGALAVYWRVFPPPGIAGNTTGISGPLLPWAIEYSFGVGNYSRGERAFATKHECDAAIPRVLKETPAGVAIKSARCINLTTTPTLPESEAEYPEPPDSAKPKPAPQWAVEYSSEHGERGYDWDLPYATKAECEAAIPRVLRKEDGHRPAHCIEMGPGGSFIGSWDPLGALPKVINGATPSAAR